MLKERVTSAEALANFELSRGASRALIEALADSEPAIRYVAAAALEKHLVGNNDLGENELQTTYLALIDLLNDKERGVHFAATSFYSLKRPPREAGLIKYRALLTLSAATGKDYGFDSDMWRRELKLAIAADAAE